MSASRKLRPRGFAGVATSSADSMLSRHGFRSAPLPEPEGSPHAVTKPKPRLPTGRQVRPVRMAIHPPHQAPRRVGAESTRGRLANEVSRARQRPSGVATRAVLLELGERSSPTDGFRDPEATRDLAVPWGFTEWASRPAPGVASPAVTRTASGPDDPSMIGAVTRSARRGHLGRLARGCLTRVSAGSADVPRSNRSAAGHPATPLRRPRSSRRRRPNEPVVPREAAP